MPTRFALYLAALVSALVIAPRGALYWDSFGYVGQALSGHIGGLALGRPLFVLVSHALALVHRAAGGSVWHLEPFLRLAWLAVAATSAPLTHALARAAGLTARGALLAGLAMALSPALAHTSSAVLTDAPALAATLLAVLLAARAVGLGDAADAQPSGESAWRAGASGAALGVAIGLRESAAYAVVPIALVLTMAPRERRFTLIAALVAGLILTVTAPVAYALRQPGYVDSVRAWTHSMAIERAQHHFAARDAFAFGAWLVTLGPVVLVAAASEWTLHTGDLVRRHTLLLAVSVPALAQLALLMFYPDIAYSPRYLLPALPGAIAIPAAAAIDRWIAASTPRALIAVALVIAPLPLAAPFVRAREAPLRRIVDALPPALAALPPHSTVVTGQPCPAVDLDRQLFRADLTIPRAADWQTQCPGWSWPDDLAARLASLRSNGRYLVLDLRDAAWIGPGQQRRLREIEAWYRSQNAATLERVVVWR